MAKFYYNTAWHSSIQMSPFEVVFGRALPTLPDYTAEASPLVMVDDLLLVRTSVLSTLKENLTKAQNHMRNKMNAKRTDVSFNVGDWVFLKLQPYSQVSLLCQPSHKLSK